jgi:hypothetical protein
MISAEQTEAGQREKEENWVDGGDFGPIRAREPARANGM